MINITIENSRDILSDSHGDALNELAKSNGFIRNAVEKAATATTRWGNKQLTSLVSSELGLSMKKARMRVLSGSRLKFDGKHKIWVGFNPIPLEYFKSVRKTQKGISAGGNEVLGAFPYNETYFVRVGNDRLPIKRATIEVDEKMENVIEDFVLDLENKLYEEYEKALQ